jgi:hypothetical protein
MPSKRAAAPPISPVLTDAWRELTAQGVIHRQDTWSDGFRVYKDQMDKIILEQRETNAKLDQLITLLQAQVQGPVT